MEWTTRWNAAEQSNKLTSTGSYCQGRQEGCPGHTEGPSQWREMSDRHIVWVQRDCSQTRKMLVVAPPLIPPVYK